MHLFAGDDKPKNSLYENIIIPVTKKPSSPTYENVLTTISITYKSPSKRFSETPPSQTSDSIYEDVHINGEGAVIPNMHHTAVLPMQGANQPEMDDIDSKLSLPMPTSGEQRPKSLSALEELRLKEGFRHCNVKSNLSSSAVCNSRSDTRTIGTDETLCRSSETTLDSSVTSYDFNATSSEATSSAGMTPYQYITNGGLSSTDLSLSEVSLLFTLAFNGTKTLVDSASTFLNIYSNIMYNVL